MIFDFRGRTPVEPQTGPEISGSFSGAPFAFKQLYLRAPEELRGQPQHKTYSREALGLIPHV